MRTKQTASNVFTDLGFEPAVSQELERKSELMIQLQNFVKRHGLTQAKAAMALGVTQPRVSQLVNGRLSGFSLDELVRLGERAGLHVTVKVEPNAKREKAIVSNVTAAIRAGEEYVYGSSVGVKRVMVGGSLNAYRGAAAKSASKQSEGSTTRVPKASMRSTSRRGSTQSSRKS